MGKSIPAIGKKYKPGGEYRIRIEQCLSDLDEIREIVFDHWTDLTPANVNALDLLQRQTFGKLKKVWPDAKAAQQIDQNVTIKWPKLELTSQDLTRLLPTLPKDVSASITGIAEAGRPSLPSTSSSSESHPDRKP